MTSSRVVFLLCAYLMATAQAAPNLLQNGGPEQLPDKTKLPPIAVSGDSGAIKYDLKPGSTALPGWTVTKASIVFYDWSTLQPGEHFVDLRGAGGISQTFATSTGQQYRLDFITNSQHDNHLKVTVGDKTMSVYVPNHGPEQAESCIFTAKSPQTTVEFTSNDPPAYGPYLKHMSVTEYDPAAEKITPAIDKLYRTMSEGFSARDTSRIGALLADDFSFQPKSGDRQDRTAWIQSLQEVMNNSGTVTSTVSHITPIENGAEVTVDVYVRTSEKDAQGTTQRVRYQYRDKDLWQSSGDTWLLKSRTEDFANRTVDR